VGNQSPYDELWWDDDIDTVNDSGFTETAINFNSAQGLNTGGSTPWIMDSDVSLNPVTPKARYLLLRSPSGMTNRASEYAIVVTDQAAPGGNGDEPLQIITPDATGVATGSAFFPLERAFDGQPLLDPNKGEPSGGAGANDAPAYSDRYGYVDFGPDWDKVHILSTWTQYRVSSIGDQTPYQELWWDDDTDTVN